MLVKPFFMCDWEGVLCIKAQFNECWKVGVCRVFGFFFVCSDPLHLPISNLLIHCTNASCVSCALCTCPLLVILVNGQMTSWPTRCKLLHQLHLGMIACLLRHS